jgi:hypothetical protein
MLDLYIRKYNNSVIFGKDDYVYDKSVEDLLV